MKTKIEIKCVFDKLLFEYECENNSIKKTVEKAIKENANLRSANLRYAKNKETAFLPIFCKWSHSIIGDKIQIGCKVKTIKDWDIFFSSDLIYETSRKTEDFKQNQAVFESYKAYINFLNVESL